MDRWKRVKVHTDPFEPAAWSLMFVCPICNLHWDEEFKKCPNCKTKLEKSPVVDEHKNWFFDDEEYFEEFYSYERNWKWLGQKK